MAQLRHWSLLTLMMVAACSGGEKPAEPAEAPVAAEEPAEAPALDKLDPAKLEADRQNIALVPSPAETQKALKAAGIDTELNSLISDHGFDFEAAELDEVAVRTGVVLADLLLTVKTSDDAQLLDHLEKLRTGMNQLNGGSDIDSLIQDMQERIRNKSVTRDEMLKEIDELSGAVIPELEFNGQERVVPLIEAGSWLEGANLVAKAVKAAGDPSKAEGLLKQPHVVEYFIKYVKNEGSEKAPPAVTEKLEASLNTLKGLAEKTEPLDEADIDQVVQVTNDVLALL